MSGVSAASDIWSVGCTVIELLTCVPPYYELQPMPALFRIVQVLLKANVVVCSVEKPAWSVYSVSVVWFFGILVLMAILRLI